MASPRRRRMAAAILWVVEPEVVVVAAAAVVVVAAVGVALGRLRLRLHLRPGPWGLCARPLLCLRPRLLAAVVAVPPLRCRRVRCTRCRPCPGQRRRSVVRRRPCPRLA